MQSVRTDGYQRKYVSSQLSTLIHKRGRQCLEVYAPLGSPPFFLEATSERGGANIAELRLPPEKSSIQGQHASKRVLLHYRTLIP